MATAKKPPRRGKRTPKGDRTLGRAIELLRTYKGWSQKQLATAMKSGNSSVSDWETGMVMPRQASLDKLVAAIGVRPQGLQLTLKLIRDLDHLQQGGGPYPPAESPASEIAERIAPGVPSVEGVPSLPPELDRLALQAGESAVAFTRALLGGLQRIVGGESR